MWQNVHTVFHCDDSCSRRKNCWWNFFFVLLLQIFASNFNIYDRQNILKWDLDGWKKNNEREIKRKHLDYFIIHYFYPNYYWGKIYNRQEIYSLRSLNYLFKDRSKILSFFFLVTIHVCYFVFFLFGGFACSLIKSHAHIEYTHKKRSKKCYYLYNRQFNRLLIDFIEQWCTQIYRPNVAKIVFLFDFIVTITGRRSINEWFFRKFTSRHHI